MKDTEVILRSEWVQLMYWNTCPTTTSPHRYQQFTCFMSNVLLLLQSDVQEREEQDAGNLTAVPVPVLVEEHEECANVILFALGNGLFQPTAPWMQ